jgi:hypothetical protein
MRTENKAHIFPMQIEKEALEVGGPILAFEQGVKSFGQRGELVFHVRDIVRFDLGIIMARECMIFFFCHEKRHFHEIG